MAKETPEEAKIRKRENLRKWSAKNREEVNRKQREARRAKDPERYEKWLAQQEASKKKKEEKEAKKFADSILIAPVVDCKCPRCSKPHKMRMFWEGNLPARKFCEYCEKHANGFSDQFIGFGGEGFEEHVEIYPDIPDSHHIRQYEKEVETSDESPSS